MYKRLSNWGMKIGILLACLVAVALWINRYDPYAIARKSMVQKLGNTPGIQQRMELYGQQALEWKTTLQPAFDTAQVVNTLTSWMQNTQACAAIFMNNTDQVDGCRFWVENLDRAADELVNLDQALTQTGQAISVSQDIGAILDENYQAGKAELMRSYQNSDQVIAGLADINQRLLNVSSTVQNVMGNPITKKISAAADNWASMGVPGAESIRSTIIIYADLPGVIQPIQIQISADTAVLKNIQTDFSDADRREAILSALGLRKMAEIVAENQQYFAAALFICFGMFLVGVIGPYAAPPSRPQRSPKPRTLAEYKNKNNRPIRIKVNKQNMPVPSAMPAVITKVNDLPHTAPRQLQNPNTDAPAYLLCKWDDGRRNKFPLTANSPTTIGSDPGNSIQTNSGRSAQSQIRIQRARKSYYLEVLTDSHPTWINSQIILSARQVDVGDIIQAGDLTAVVVI